MTEVLYPKLLENTAQQLSQKTFQSIK